MLSRMLFTARADVPAMQARRHAFTIAFIISPRLMLRAQMREHD
jgi:hypothetical protein